MSDEYNQDGLNSRKTQRRYPAGNNSGETQPLKFDNHNAPRHGYADSGKKSGKTWLWIILAVAIVGCATAVYGQKDTYETDTPVLTDDEEAVEVDDSWNYDDEPTEEEPTEEEPAGTEELANDQRVTDLVVSEDEHIQEIPEDKSGSDAVSEGIYYYNKQFIEDVVVSEAPAPEPEKTYTAAMVEQKPEFPGGEAAMFKWISENIKYPAIAEEEGAQGRVIVTFDIDKDGSIVNARIARGRHPDLDREAIRLVNSMPRWSPGRNNGQPVKVTYNIPITFRLQQ